MRFAVLVVILAAGLLAAGVVIMAAVEIRERVGVAWMAAEASFDDGSAPRGAPDVIRAIRTEPDGTCRRTPPPLISLGPLVAAEPTARLRHDEVGVDGVVDEEEEFAESAGVSDVIEESSGLDSASSREAVRSADGLAWRERHDGGTGIVLVTLSIPAPIDLRWVKATLRAPNYPIASIALFPAPSCLARTVALSLLDAAAGEHDLVVSGRLGEEEFTAAFPRVLVVADRASFEPRLLGLDPVVLLARTPRPGR